MNDADLTEWSLAAIENEITTIAASIAAATARQMDLLSELERRGAWATQGFDSPAHWLARRLACDASLVVMTRGPDGEPIASRRKRLLSAALRRAMIARDRQCTFPGCSNRIVDGHHCRHWANGGETALSNVIALCRSCHVRVHEGGWRAEVTPNGTRFFRPDGRELRVPATVATRALTPPPGADASTILPRWDGTPIDYGWAVDSLMAAGTLPAR